MIRAPLRVLIVEDSELDTHLISHALRNGGRNPVCERVETAAGMQAALKGRTWDVIICDYSLPNFDGPAALALYQRQGLDIPFICVSGAVGEETVAELIKAGAHNYVMKNRLNRLVEVVERELRAAEQRRSRQRQEATTTFLASIVESCDDAIVGKTLDGVVVSWNTGAERLFGYTAREMLGRSVSVLFPLSRPYELPEILEKIKRGERVAGVETVRLRKDGTSVEVLLTVSPIKNAAGQIIGASTVARDISRRRQEENERLELIKDLTAALSQAAA